MLGYFVLGTLAAFGAFCAAWLIFGGLLPCWQGCMLLCLRPEETRLEAVALCCGFLRGIGIVRAPLVIADAALSDAALRRLSEKYPGIEFCTLEELERRDLG